ncbi:heme peroxidase [Mycena polygramma]|nr:heme peroxidase [Mycena polygramma]
MRSISFSLLAILLLETTVPVYGTPQLMITRRKGGADATTGGGGGSGSGITTAANAKNPVCKPWYAIRDDIMGGVFGGRCNDLARASVRLAFHDAGPFSLARQQKNLPNGAADGSLLVDNNGGEGNRPENNGLQNIVAALKPIVKKYGVSPGDVLHLAGTLGVVACPGGPVVNTYIGRPLLPKNIAPDGLLPNPNSPVSVLTARFADMSFSIRELMALMGAHSTGRQRFVSLAQANASFDSTIDIWDVRFYSETQNAAAAPGTFRLNSDVAFSHDSSTVKDYNRFVGKQDDWGREYAAAHEKMSLLGMNKNTLTDCTEIMPSLIDLKNLAVGSSSSGKQTTAEPIMDPAKVEAAIQQQRSIWLK